MWRKALAAAILCIGPCTALQAQPATIGQKTSLIQAWLAVPDVAQVTWPYAFIQASGTDESEKARRDDLFDQFEQLKWRLGEGGYTGLVKTVGEWKSQLSRTPHYRQPGDWSPAWLMAHPHERPPIARVVALGYCQPPDSVQIWDEAGVHRVKWKPGLRLSDVLGDDPKLKGGSTDEVAVVSPRGNIDHYGVAAWNYADTDLIPGTRIVGAIDLKGAVFPWMRDAIAGLLAHTPTGDACRRFLLRENANHG